MPANPIIPQIMPAINFPGLDAGVVWNDISPRLGMTYDLMGTGKSVARASYSMYYGQMAPGQLAGELISIGQVSVRYPVGRPERRHVRAGQRAEPTRRRS